MQTSFGTYKKAWNCIPRLYVKVLGIPYEQMWE